jgi:hypothetical protein
MERSFGLVEIFFLLNLPLSIAKQLMNIVQLVQAGDCLHLLFSCSFIPPHFFVFVVVLLLFELILIGGIHIFVACDIARFDEKERGANQGRKSNNYSNTSPSSPTPSSPSSSGVKSPRSPRGRAKKKSQ